MRLRDEAGMRFPPRAASRYILSNLEGSAVNRSWLLWIVALAVTLLGARYQRVTGPTYPLHGNATLGGHTFGWTLERTHAGTGDHEVRIEPGSTGVQGALDWRPLEDGAWRSQAMRAEGESLVASIPHQPIAAKVAYRVRLAHGGREITLPESDPAVMRFRGEVPAWVLIPHILAMFAAMLYSTRAGLETLSPSPKFGGLAARTIAALVVGGILLGCMVAWYAFRMPWGGFPISNDLTDNKTLLALVVWLIAAAALRLGRRPKPWVLAASIVTLLVYLVPHSASLPQP